MKRTAFPFCKKCKNNGFTLIEAVCFFTILSAVIATSITFHFTYRKNLLKKIRKVTDIHLIERFSESLEKTLFTLKEKDPEATVDYTDSKLFISSKNTSDFSIIWANERLEVKHNEGGNIKESSLGFPLKDVTINCGIPDEQLKDLRLKNLQYLDITFKTEQMNTDILIPLL